MIAEPVIVAVQRIKDRLDAHTRPELAGVPTLIVRGLKLAEETGELAAAVIGLLGANPRKGITHSAADVASEAVDVVITAAVFAETALPGAAARALRLWESRPARQGRDLASTIAGTSAILDRRVGPALSGPAGLAFRALRVQAAGGAVADTIRQVVEFHAPDGWRDPNQWWDAVHAALNAAADALVVVEAVCPGEVAAVVADRVGYVAERAEHFADGPVVAASTGGR
ncbi:MAG TPA: MazG-like family protein [Rugosimonospora sp.]|nr:MazG-like family protein [Rugosimonospora sp.]